MKRNESSKQPKLGSLWVKQEHLSEHNRVVAGLKATIQMLLSVDSFNAKRIRHLTEEVNRLKEIIRCKNITFEEYDEITKTFS